ncbi:MFS transporter [Streptomyces sp. CBMA152]|uniref:MFS transporter n=1 Tax=Streptomyces sp. CBMA152 TaxID=1896312 RepID=UPI002948BE4F|nr:MFS transporter [Streptomyces sp. CBMA152]
MRLLRRGPVLGLWAGQTFSVFGDRLYAMAIMWIAWQKSGAAAMGFVAVAESVPYIVTGTVGRRLVARLNSLKALACVDVARAGVVAVIPLVWTHTGLAEVLALVVLVGWGGAVFDPNLSAIVPDLVDKDSVQTVIGLMDLSGRIARIAGPGTAGALLALMPMPALFLVDAATFAASALSLAFLAPYAARIRHRTPPAARDVAGRPRARDVLRKNPEVAAAITVHGIGIACTAVTMALPALLATRLDAGAAAYGAVLAATGAGALAGNTIAGHWRIKGPVLSLYCGLWAVSGVLLAVMGAAFSLPFLAAVAAVSGMVAPFLQITLATYLSMFEPALRLRLMTVDLTVIRTGGTAAMLFVPALAAPRPGAAYAMAGAATAAAGLLGALLVLRHRRTEVPEKTSEREMARE